MTRREREPQSYGSGEDWVTGKTGQKVHDVKAPPPPEQRDFYDSRRDSETSAPEQGGRPSEAQVSERQSGAPAGGESTPVQKVTSTESGAKRDSYFKKRDYE